MITVAAIGICLGTGLGGCMGTPVARYDWTFRQVSPDAVEQDKAFSACKAMAQRTANRIGAANLRIWTFASTLESCMKQNGWQSEGRPVSISYI